jgi:hypothetical protein
MNSDLKRVLWVVVSLIGLLLGGMLVVEKDRGSAASLREDFQSEANDVSTSSLQPFEVDSTRLHTNSGLVQVLDRQTLEPIEGVVFSRVGEDLDQLSSDSDGLLTTNGHEGRVFTAKHPRYSSWEGELRSGVSVLMDRKPTVRGRVFGPGHDVRDYSGVFVVAWVGDLPGPDKVLEAIGASHSPAEVSVVACKEDGSFEFPMLNGEQPVRLSAGGGGLASQPLSGVLATPAGKVEIPVYWAHAVEVVFERSTGGPAMISARACAPNSFTLKNGTEGVTPLAARCPQMYLNGFVRPLTAQWASSRKLLVLLAGKKLEGNERPYYSGEYLGYEPVNVRLEVDIIDRGYTTQTVSLVPLSDSVADLEITFGQILSEAINVENQLTTLNLRSHALGKGGYFLIMGDAQDGLTIPGIPVGPYSGTLSTSGGAKILLGAEGKTSEFELGPEGTTLNLEQPGLAWLEVTVRNPDGSEYTGPATFDIGSLISANQRKSRSVAFSRAPYRIALAETGTYAGAIISPHISDLTCNGAIHFEVLAEGRVQLDTTLPAE